MSSTCPSCGLLTSANGVCTECTRTFAATLAQAPQLYLSAHIGLRPSLTQAPDRNGRVTGGAGPGSRPPVRSEVLGASDLFARLLCAWELHTLSLLALDPVERCVRVGHLVQRASHTIGCHLDVALGAPAGIAFALSAERAAHELRTHLGMTETHTRLAEPCPECDRRALTCADTSRAITCNLCGARWTDEQYRDAVTAMFGA